MNRFNLTFRGDILPGHDPEEVKVRLAEALAIDDPQRLQQCFSGDTVILRRDLDRKSAAEFYAKLHQLGAQAELVKTGERGLVQGKRDAQPTSQAVAAPEKRRGDLATKKNLQQQDQASKKTTEETLQKKLEETLLAREKEQAKKDKPAKRKAAQKQQKSQAAEKTRIAAQREEQARLEREKKQRAAEAKARIVAEREEKARLEREKKAEQQRLAAAAKAAQREREKREAEQRAARAKVEQARRKREQAAEAARRKAEEVRKRAQEQARLKAAEEEQRAQRKAMEEQAIQRAATELAGQPSLKPVAARVKTTLELPSKKRVQAGSTEPTRKRQPGEPNLYTLSPFRNTPEVRARSEQSQRRMRAWYIVSAIALAGVLILAGAMLSLPPTSIDTGPRGIAINPQQQLALLVGDHLLLHDRAGLGTSDLRIDSLGLAALEPPMAFNASGELLAMGRLTEAPDPATAIAKLQLLRCDLTETNCRVYSQDLAHSTISGFVVHPLDGTLFVADAEAGELLKLSGDGVILARTTTAIPARPLLRLDSGLLLMNSALGPAISVFRYEDDAFGKQLDEILLLVPDTPESGYSAVRDFVSNGESWWVALDKPGANSADLLRFDPHWQFIEKVVPVPDTRVDQLALWGKKVLVTDSGQPGIARFSKEGLGEAPLLSELLAKLLDQQRRESAMSTLAWRSGLALCAIVLLVACCIGSLYRMRSLVYQSCRERGAEPVDKLAEHIEWIPLADNREARLARTGIGYGVLVTGLVLCAIGFGVSALQLTALLLALLGPALMLVLLHRSEPGHIGIASGELLLVDHNGIYHMGGDGRIHYRDAFLMIDDVVVFSGSRLLPAFNVEQLITRVKPVAGNGVKVDRKILTVKLLQGRHPLALGAAATLASTIAAIALLSLQGLS